MDFRIENSPLLPRARWLLLVCGLLLMVACAPSPTRPDAARSEAAQVAREQRIRAQATWSLRGRVALSARGQGGSGRIEWRQEGEDFDLRLSAPVTGQSWRLLRQGGRVRLEGLEGGPREGNDAESLLVETTGWRIPIDSMRNWVRGARAEGGSRLDFDAEGRPSLLQQRGWTVEFRDWDRSEPPRPGRIYARQGDATVRLVVDEWGYR